MIYKLISKDFFDIYTQNPETVNLLIMKSGDKIVARALVWKLKTTKPQLGFTYYMDRVYSVRDHQVKVMMAFAEKQGWACFASEWKHGSLPVFDQRLRIVLSLGYFIEPSYAKNTFKNLLTNLNNNV